MDDTVRSPEGFSFSMRAYARFSLSLRSPRRFRSLAARAGDGPGPPPASARGYGQGRDADVGPTPASGDVSRGSEDRWDEAAGPHSNVVAEELHNLTRGQSRKEREASHGE